MANWPDDIAQLKDIYVYFYEPEMETASAAHTNLSSALKLRSLEWVPTGWATGGRSV